MVFGFQYLKLHLYTGVEGVGGGQTRIGAFCGAKIMTGGPGKATGATWGATAVRGVLLTPLAKTASPVIMLETFMLECLNRTDQDEEIFIFLMKIRRN